MKGHDPIIAMLNDVLTAELTVINQYFIHARMCENWGYERLWKKLREESLGEMRHAGIAQCVDLGDNGTRELPEGILLIQQVGEAHYLAQQIKGEEGE